MRNLICIRFLNIYTCVYLEDCFMSMALPARAVGVIKCLSKVYQHILSHFQGSSPLVASNDYGLYNYNTNYLSRAIIILCYGVIA